MKLNKKLTSILVTGAMIASIGGTTAMTSFAKDVDLTGAAEANLVKYLEMGDGVQIPNEAFTFTFTAQNGGPAIAAQTITPATETDSEDDEGAVYGAKSFDKILSGVQFQSAGVYTYLVAETTPAEKTEGMVYDTDSFFVNIFVENTKDGLAVTNITAQENIPGEDDEGNPINTGAKVDVTVEDPTETPDGNAPGSEAADAGDKAANGLTVYGLTFDNSYTKTMGEDPEDPEDIDDGDDVEYDATKAALDVTKTVEGTYADKAFAFPFEITLIAPANYEVPADGELAILNGKAVHIKYGENNKYTFNLADGEQLVIPTLPAGATYKVTETAVTNDKLQNAEKYTTAIALTTEGAEAATINAKTTDDVLLTDVEPNDVAAYTNTLDDDDVTPTGILMQNAPYILVATLAAGGLVIYLAKRREEEEEA